ncbi:anti-sigma factor [Lederbergia galactosidilytica]|uniref:Anti-sigma-M factor yhdL n=1 Tax=Lederbergia galactosidilytica TaxID=217031 RepID=A0A177ZM93_9BACI|nr:anti-sigma factor [Lederbergia galactosidilytica]KRG12585.1 anti-sigma-M factor yhdL [Virgibacillus soli]MBP1916053.1 hypothetical protein [Lederbergia galactosidilytica]OAK68470.1 anti-sigma-M factor yhdL [Lederbergia galactosidilytica]
MTNKINKEDEKLYRKILHDAKQSLQGGPSEEEQRKIIKTGKNNARLTNILISLAIILLILPILTLTTFVYYGFGGKADRLMDVAIYTVYVTEPNISLRPMEIEDDIGLFSMHVLFDVYKRIGKEDYKAGDYDILFNLSQPDFLKKNYYLDRPMPEIPTKEAERLLHPTAVIPFWVGEEWSKLNGLPDGTVAELYLSLSEVLDPAEVSQLMPKGVEVRWLAVDTGLEAEQQDVDGLPLTPIGYPVQVDSTTWSPFNGREKSNQEVFLDLLDTMEQNEDVAVKVASAKSLALNERIAYLKENDIKVYGAVVTGPTPELRKLKDVKEFRAMKVGEVKLWN